MTAIDDSDPADAIDALEAEYQTYRVLADSSSLTATITGCGVEDATVLVELSVLGVTCSFTLESTVADLCSLARLCEQVGTPFTGEFDALTGEPIDVTFDSSLETVSIPAVELTDRPVVFVLATDKYTDVPYESVRAVQTEYTFWPFGVSEAECKHLLEFVFEQTTATLYRAAERSRRLD